MPPRARFLRLPVETRTRILDAATNEFSTKQFHKASINRIATAARVSKGSLYYYFENKADLLAAVLEAAMARMAQDTGGLVSPMLDSHDSTTFWSAARQVVGDMTRWTADHPDSLALLKAYFQLLQAPDSPAHLHEMIAQGYRSYEQVMVHGQRVGAVRTDMPVGLLTRITWAMGEASDQWFASQVPDDGVIDPQQMKAEAEAYADLMADLLYRACRPAPSNGER